MNGSVACVWPCRSRSLPALLTCLASPLLRCVTICRHNERLSDQPADRGASLLPHPSSPFSSLLTPCSPPPRHRPSEPSPLARPARSLPPASRPQLAMLHNDRHVLENHHAYVCCRLLEETGIAGALAAEDKRVRGRDPPALSASPAYPRRVRNARDHPPIDSLHFPCVRRCSGSSSLRPYWGQIW